MIKKLISYSINFLVGFIVSVYVPVSILIALNLVKGPGYYNPEGEMFKPIGWIMLVFLLGLLSIVILLNIKKFKLRLFNNISSKTLFLFLIAGLLFGGFYQRNGIVLLIKFLFFS